MARRITYRDTVRVKSSVADTVRDTIQSWHDPSADQHLERWQETPDFREDGTQATIDTEDAYLVQVRASQRGVGDDAITASLDNLVSAINTAFPADWPTVTTDDLTVESDG